MTDLRFALRQFRKAPGFCAAVVLTTAVGIGACAAVFAVVDAVLLRPLPFPDSDRLVNINETNLPRWPAGSVRTAPGKFFDWQERATSFEALAAKRNDTVNFTGTGEPARVTVGRVTPNAFRVLGISPVLGRDLQPDDDLQGRPRVVLLSHGFWLRRFGGRPDVLGRSLRLDEQNHTIVGVMPRGVEIDGALDLFSPIRLPVEARDERRSRTIDVFARLKRGVSVSQAQAEMDAVSGALARLHPARAGAWGAKVTTMLEAQVGSVKRMLIALLAAVAFLLLIACANVANLLLAKATGRGREVALRVALGATRARLIRQLLTETLLLFTAGALLGLLAAEAGMHALLALAPESIPRSNDIAINGPVLAFTLLLTLVTGVVCGLAPALETLGPAVNQKLRSGAKGSGTDPGRTRLRAVLVVVQTAVTLVLLVGAGLMFRSFQRLQDVDPGFEPRDTLALNLTLPTSRYRTLDEQSRFADTVIERLEALPGVRAAAATWVAPFSSSRGPMVFQEIAGRPHTDLVAAAFYPVTSQYFRTLGIQLRRGRSFVRDDRDGSQPVAIVNESFARKVFPDEDVLGKRIRFAEREEDWRVIVGVVSDVRHGRVDLGAPPQVYEPFAQRPRADMTIVLRGVGFATAAEVRDTIRSIDPDQPIARIRSLSDWIAESIGRQRFALVLFSVFSGVALVLASVGLYGVVAYSVGQRRAEIGIRMALGARSGNIIAMVLAHGSRLLGAGLAIGLLASLVLTRFLQSLLFEISPHDPATFAVIALLLAAIATVACVLPARYAARVNPMVVLRAE